jgi:transposase-like protein
MYRIELGLCDFERITGISHGSIYNWIKQSELLDRQNSQQDNLTLECSNL